jgi:uncharacterized membrane protein SpoIIM required for sporulation
MSPIIRRDATRAFILICAAAMRFPDQLIRWQVDQTTEVSRTEERPSQAGAEN